MITADGRAKVLDFGLAKLRDPPLLEADASALPTATVTGEGRILGTVAYMSPEQAEGKPLDSRSDIFSLGVMLFEMATGKRPFVGDTSVSLLSSIIKDTPQSVTDLKPALPRELSRIIKRCLVKDPEYRYQSAKDLRNELRELEQASAAAPPGAAGPRRAARVAASVLLMIAVGLIVGRLWFTRGAAGGPINSLAVLPFVNVGSDPNTEYLSDGITENLINSLSQLPKLRVVPRSRVFRYKGREAEAERVGRDLGAMEQLRKTLEIDPSFALAHSYLGLAYEQKGLFAQAISEFHEWQRLSGDEPAATGALGHAYAISGKRTDAQNALVRLKGLSASEYVAPYDLAVICVGLGDTRQAMDWLDRAYEDHSAWLIWINVDPRFDGTRNDPRYRDLLRRMKLPA